MNISTLNRTAMYSCQVLGLLALLFFNSCKSDDTEDLGNYKGKVPENVQMSDYSSSSISVSWDTVADATSYMVQLLDDRSSEKPLDRFVVIGNDSYTFEGLNDTADYFVRVRANLNTVTSDWVYIMDGDQAARIIPRYGVVAADFVVPKEPVLYANFPEGWENHEGARKSSYSGDSDVFPTGEWLMPEMYSISAGSITNKIGTWAMLLRGGESPFLEMNFDLPNGASKFSFYYGAATQNANDTKEIPIDVTVEYSIDGGETWIQMGDVLVVSSVDEQYYEEYLLDIKGPVRFRIGKDASLARLFIDDIAVYSN